MFRIFIALCCSLFFSVIAQANSKPILNIYTYSSFISQWGPGPKIKTLFEANCHCEVKFSSFGDGVTILNRLKLEGSRSKADIIIGLDNNLIAAAKAADIVRPHEIAPFNNLQLDWWDNDFVPYDYGYFAFIYNKEKITTPPRSMQALIADDNNWKIVYQDPRTSTPGLGLLLWIESIYGSDAPKAWQQLSKKTLTVTKGWSEAYGLLLNGEADFVLSYDTSPVVHILNDGDYRYAAAEFSEGHYEQIEVAAIVKTTHQFKLAQQFLIFLSEPEVQRVLALNNIMHPVIKTELPDAFDQLIHVEKPLMISPNEVELHRKAWIESWQNAVSH